MEIDNLQIGNIYYFQPLKTQIEGGIISIPEEFNDAIDLNGGFDGIQYNEDALILARKGIWIVNNQLWQFVNVKEQEQVGTYIHPIQTDIDEKQNLYAGLYLFCGTVYDKITQNIDDQYATNNINEYIWQNGDIKIEYEEGEDEETAEIKLGEIIEDNTKLLNSDYIPNTIQLYCKDKTVTGTDSVIDKIVFYVAGTNTYDYVFDLSRLNYNIRGINVYKTGCVAKVVLKDSVDGEEITYKVTKTSTDMEYLAGIISNASKAKTKLAPIEGGYIYTANGTIDEETQEFVPTNMMSIGDVINLDNKKELIGAKYLVGACTKGDVYYISGRGYEYSALWALLDNTNKIIDMYEGKVINEELGTISWTEWNDEFTLEIPEGVTKILYNSTSQGSIYKNQTLADVAEEAVTRGMRSATAEEEFEELKQKFNKHITNELDTTAVHLTQEQKDDLLNPPEGGGEGNNEGGGETGGGTEEE